LFRLAGSGWYETDFKSDKESKRNLAGKDEAPAADAGGEKKPSDTKADDAKKTVVAKPPVTTAAKARSKTVAKKPAAKKAARKR
jgi:hypothetical protein